MQILITGGTGLIGRALIQALPEEQITVLTRSPEQAETLLPAHVQCIKTLDDISDFNQFDAVINLAGEPIIDKRWNEHQKGIICSSRWGITEDIVNHIKNCDNPPAVFISGSAVGYYGNQDDRQIDESLEVESEAFRTPYVPIGKKLPNVRLRKRPVSASYAQVLFSVKKAVP